MKKNQNNKDTNLYAKKLNPNNNNRKDDKNKKVILAKSKK